MAVLKQCLSNFKSILINVLVWLFIVGVFGLPLLILVIWRYFVNFLSVRIHSDLTPCSPNDTLLVHETPDKQPILTGGIILRVKGKIDSSKLKLLFEELFLSQENFENYRNLYCDLVRCGGYLFKRQIVPKVKLENHFTEEVLEQNQDFKVVIASWFQKKFQKGLPLWQMLVLHEDGENQGDDSISYFAFKAHHALMDGYSFVHLLDKLTGVTSPGEWVGTSFTGNNNNTSCTDADDNTKEVDENSAGRSFWTNLKILFYAPEVVASFTFPNISFSNTFSESKPLRHFEMLPMACGTSCLEPLKEIRRMLGVHFPALIYGLQVGVLRAALLDNRANTAEDDSKKLPMMEDSLPECVLISTSLPVIGVEHPRNKFTNHWSGGYIKVPLKTASAKHRIEQANQSLESILANEGTYITWKYLAFLLWLFPTWFHCLLDKCSCLRLCKYQASMSCIPQSCSVQYNLMGLPVQNLYHAPIMKDCFLSAVLLGCSSSHNSQVDFSVFGHPDWFRDQKSMNITMSDYMRRELERLTAECNIDFHKLEWRTSV